MDWKALGSKVADFAPLLGGALGGPGGAAVGAIVSSVFGSKNDPAEIERAISADPEAALKLLEIEKQHAEALAKLTIENETTRLVETQVTMRAEIKSEDPFVRRARPFLIWIIGASIALMVATGAAVIFVAPGQVAALAQLFEAISLPLSIAAAMCGVYIKKRSDDKSVAAGAQQGPGLLSALLSRGEK